jgi:hypothetical protein
MASNAAPGAVDPGLDPAAAAAAEPALVGTEFRPTDPVTIVDEVDPPEPVDGDPPPAPRKKSAREEARDEIIANRQRVLEAEIAEGVRQGAQAPQEPLSATPSSPGARSGPYSLAAARRTRAATGW